MATRRGDNIPSVSDYAHWNEDAYRMWYEENKYDMMYADEIIEDDDNGRDYLPDPFQDGFDTEAEARAFVETLDSNPEDVSEWKGRWYVEHYDKDAHDKRKAT